jgi:hypothetical protein
MVKIKAQISKVIPMINEKRDIQTKGYRKIAMMPVIHPNIQNIIPTIAILSAILVISQKIKKSILFKRLTYLLHFN